MSAKDRVLVIDGEGTLHGLYDPTLKKIGGEMTVVRASEVEFDNERQIWDVVLADGTHVCSREDRPDAIDAEVDYLNAKIAEDPDYVKRAMEK
jgi:hypothetical protein